jgi:hypothetical protein
VKKGNFVLEMLRELKKMPCPKGMTSRDIVTHAIEFKDPPRIPYSFVYNPPATDIAFTGSVDQAPAKRKLIFGDRYVDSWGVTWEFSDRAWDHAIEHPLTDLAKVENHRFPDFTNGIRQAVWYNNMARKAGKYLLGLNPIMMFETMRSLMGFDELMVAPFTQPDGLHKLLGRLTEETIRAIETFVSVGVDGFMTLEDWGLQTSLQMNIETFRKFYKPYYARMAEACHKHGIHFFWHNCGHIMDMLPDMIEIGVDVVQLDQPRLMGHDNLVRMLGGKMCMWNTVDIQWSGAENITEQDICDEVANMVHIYDVEKYHGGFIAKHYPSPWDIELSVKRQRLIYRSFMENGCALP